MSDLIKKALLYSRPPKAAGWTSEHLNSRVMGDNIELRNASNDPGSSDAMNHLLHDSKVEPHRIGILRLTVDIPVPPSSQQAVQSRPAARWRTPEFIFYGCAFIVAIPVMIWKTVDLSQRVFSLFLCFHVGPEYMLH